MLLLEIFTHRHYLPAGLLRDLRLDVEAALDLEAGRVHTRWHHTPPDDAIPSSQDTGRGRTHREDSPGLVLSYLLGFGEERACIGLAAAQRSLADSLLCPIERVATRLCCIDDHTELEYLTANATSSSPIAHRVHAIGRVDAPLEPGQRSDTSPRSWIHLDRAQFHPALLAGLEPGALLEVIYLFDRVSFDAVLEGASPGLFSRRGAARPNRIGLSLCRLHRIEGLTLEVEGLDALDRTPVLDLKPWRNDELAQVAGSPGATADAVGPRAHA